MDVSRPEHKMLKFTHGEAGSIRRLPGGLQSTVHAFGIIFKVYEYEYGIF